MNLPHLESRIRKRQMTPPQFRTVEALTENDKTEIANHLADASMAVGLIDAMGRNAMTGGALDQFSKQLSLVREKLRLVAILTRVADSQPPTNTLKEAQREWLNQNLKDAPREITITPPRSNELRELVITDGKIVSLKLFT